MLGNLLFSSALFLNALEDPYAFIALITGGAVCLGYFKRSYALSFFVVIGLTFATTHIIKSIYRVARPADALVTLESYRFPSMHSAIAAALLASFAWYLSLRFTSLLSRMIIWSIAGGLIAFVGYTRVLLGVHEVIDVVVGTLIGVCITIGLHLLMRKYKLE